MSSATRIAALQAAIDAGVAEVQENGRRTKYPGLDAVRRALSAEQAATNVADSALGVVFTPLKAGSGK